MKIFIISTAILLLIHGLLLYPVHFARPDDYRYLYGGSIWVVAWQRSFQASLFFYICAIAVCVFQYKALVTGNWRRIVLASFVASTCLFLSGQVVVQRTSSVTEQYLVFPIRESKYRDELAPYLTSRVEEDIRKEYTCYPYCDSFLWRKYRTGNDQYLVVFNGIGGWFALH